MFKEFRCTENTDKALNLQNFSPDRPKITKLLLVDLSFKTIIFKQQMEFQNFKIIQEFKNVQMRRFFFFFFLLFLTSIQHKPYLYG